MCQKNNAETLKSLLDEEWRQTSPICYSAWLQAEPLQANHPIYSSSIGFIVTFLVTNWCETS